MMLFVLAVTWISLISCAHAVGPADYCQWEIFHANCTDGEVVMMTTAEYGRMRPGRCIQSDYQTKCSANVIDHVDGRCSGRKSCSIQIPDPKMFQEQPCRKDLVAYFKASYECIPVINPLREQKVYCHGLMDISKYKNGYIASSITSSMSFGSRRCPWKIAAPPGQKINITLFDFSTRTTSATSPPGSSAAPTGQVPRPRACPIHAVVEETASASDEEIRSKSVELCPNLTRRRWLYTSESNRITIKMINVTKQNDENVNFLLHYAIIGCADIEPLPHAKIERKGDSLVISCQHTKERWHLVCKGTTWIGDYHNCSSSSKMAREDKHDEDQGFPLGLLIAIAIGVVVGVVLGFVFLIAIFICRRRSRREGKHDSGNPLMGGAALDPDQQNIYRLVEVRPPPTMMCDCQYTPVTDHKQLGSMDNPILMPSSPGECIYRTAPRMDAGEYPFQSREGDTFKPQYVHPVKPCDIISDIHVPTNPACCEGQDWYTTKQQCDRADNENYPIARIPPFPGFNRGERGSLSRNQMPSRDSDSVTDILDASTTPPTTTSTFQPT